MADRFAHGSHYGVGGYQQWESVPTEVVEEIAFRTPGFSGWQSERWYTHCGDAAEFLGPMGKEDLVKFGPEVIEMFKVESGLEGDEWEFYFSGAISAVMARYRRVHVSLAALPRSWRC